MWSPVFSEVYVRESIDNTPLEKFMDKCDRVCNVVINKSKSYICRCIPQFKIMLKNI
jgi:hypothetical protein